MTSSSELLPLSDVAHGTRFAAFVFSSFGRPVSLPSLGPGSFSLLVAFGRCRFRLEESLRKLLALFWAGLLTLFHVGLVEERIFLFTVSCKKVGFEIYKLRTLKCVEFELFFQLYNDSGIAFARARTDCAPVFTWQEVGKKASYSEIVQNAPLNAANSVHSGSHPSAKMRPPRYDSVKLPLSRANSVQLGSWPSSTQQIVRNAPRISVFKRIQFPRRSNAARSGKSAWKPKRTQSQRFQAIFDNQGGVPDVQNISVHHSVHASHQRHASSQDDLNLDLNLGSFNFVNGAPVNLAPSVAETSSVPVLCRRCHSSSHPRHACRAPIKCDFCLGWGHVAASCIEKWKSWQSCVNLEKIDNFGKDFGAGLDYSHWFNPARMTAGPSTPPRFTNFLDLSVGPSAYHGVINIPWCLQNPTRVNEHCSALPENPNSSTSHPSELGVGDSSMAFVRADPAPFIPRGLNRLDVQARKPMERVVLMRPRTKNQDLAIAIIHPMHQQQVTFQAIRDVVADYLTNVQRVELTDMQPTHLGQAFVRFRNAFDRDRLIQMGPFQFGDVTLSFVEHNKGRNWRAVTFNRECWMLLLGYPPDYREDEFVVNTIRSFGRVISWVDDARHLSRIQSEPELLITKRFPNFLCSLMGKVSRVNHGLFNVRFFRGNCWVAYPKIRIRHQDQMFFHLGALLTFLVLVRRVLALLLLQTSRPAQILPCPLKAESLVMGLLILMSKTFMIMLR